MQERPPALRPNTELRYEDHVRTAGDNHVAAGTAVALERRPGNFEKG